MAGIRVGTGVEAAWGIILGPVGRPHTGQQVQGWACGWVFMCQSGLGAGGCTGKNRTEQAWGLPRAQCRPCTSIDMSSGADLGWQVQLWVQVGTPACWCWHNSNGIIITVNFVMDEVGVPGGVPLVLGDEWGRWGWAYWVVGPVLSSFLSAPSPLSSPLSSPPSLESLREVGVAGWLCIMAV
jgi:hypothetical protein